METTEAFDYTIDPEASAIAFEVSNFGVSVVKGHFRQFSGTIHFAPGNVQSLGVRVRIQTASIDTGLSLRDQHLRSSDFFDASTHPEILFAGTDTTSVGEKTFRLHGDLTLHGVTRPVELEGQYRDTGDLRQRVAFEGQTVIDRTEYGVQLNSVVGGAGFVIGKKVTIHLDIEGTRPDAST